MSTRSGRNTNTDGAQSSSAVVAFGKKRSFQVAEEEEEEEALVIFGPENAEPTAALMLRQEVRSITSGPLDTYAKVAAIVASMAKAQDSHALEELEFLSSFNASFLCAIFIRGDFKEEMSWDKYLCQPDPGKKSVE